jgi:ABC-type Mn2+/Zn2+ transport system ATPase subunit
MSGNCWPGLNMDRNRGADPPVGPYHGNQGASLFLLKTESLYLGYGRLTVLKEVNIAVREGEFWFFLGPNGAGKTTLLKALLKEIRPQQGRILTHPELYRRENFGFVPQHCDLNATLSTTVREFVLLGLVGIPTNRVDREQRLVWALGKVGLTGMAAQNYWSLSWGQRQRALVARALVRRPRILFLDEPTRGLDLAAEEALMRSLAILNRQEQFTLLFVTHDLSLAVRYASHVALFHDGLVESGPMAGILTPENLQRAYGVPISIAQEPSGKVAIMMGGGGKTA